MGIKAEIEPQKELIMDEKTILVVDDNEEIREVVRLLLESEGYIVKESPDGADALNKIDDSIDLIILDVMLPGKSGFLTCAELRKITMAPILFLTAKSQDSDKTMGFQMGGDDYLSKPFSYQELLSRVKALLRRYYVYGQKELEEKEDYIVSGNLKINRNFNEVFKNDKEISLTDIEYKMLLLMADNYRKIFSAQNLYESVWGEPYFYISNDTIMVHIRKLRVKLEDDPQNPVHIRTVWGKGYRFE